MTTKYPLKYHNYNDGIPFNYQTRAVYYEDEEHRIFPGRNTVYGINDYGHTDLYASYHRDFRTDNGSLDTLPRAEYQISYPYGPTHAPSGLWVSTDQTKLEVIFNNHERRERRDPSTGITYYSSDAWLIPSYNYTPYRYLKNYGEDFTWDTEDRHTYGSIGIKYLHENLTIGKKLNVTYTPYALILVGRTKYNDLFESTGACGWHILAWYDSWGVSDRVSQWDASGWWNNDILAQFDMNGKHYSVYYVRANINDPSFPDNYRFMANTKTPQDFTLPFFYFKEPGDPAYSERPDDYKMALEGYEVAFLSYGVEIHGIWFTDAE